MKRAIIVLVLRSFWSGVRPQDLSRPKRRRQCEWPAPDYFLSGFRKIRTDI